VSGLRSTGFLKNVDATHSHKISLSHIQGHEKMFRNLLITGPAHYRFLWYNQPVKPGTIAAGFFIISIEKGVR